MGKCLFRRGRNRVPIFTGLHHCRLLFRVLLQKLALTILFICYAISLVCSTQLVVVCFPVLLQCRKYQRVVHGKFECKPAAGGDAPYTSAAQPHRNIAPEAVFFPRDIFVHRKRAHPRFPINAPDL